jgi:hypothetical protein
MVKVFKNLKMVMYIKENTNKVNQMDMVSIIGKMGLSIKVFYILFYRQFC